uniref:MAGE domain-containing protein n=1 Tax=Prolemur simus TaxID=1328070 RepID=A0A8C9A961_PROSS
LGLRGLSPPGQTEPYRNAIKFCKKDPIEEKVAMLVHYLLSKYQVKEPITKGDMLRNVVQMYKSHFPEILRRASNHLELVFGLDVKEVDPNRNTYVLVNKIELTYDASRGMPKTGLLMIVLGVIFTKGNRATEEQVWKVLNTIGVYDGGNHFIYGEPRKLLTDDQVQMPRGKWVWDLGKLQILQCPSVLC